MARKAKGATSVISIWQSKTRQFFEVPIGLAEYGKQGRQFLLEESQWLEQGSRKTLLSNVEKHNLNKS